MKAEYEEPNNNNATAMFPTFHPHKEKFPITPFPHRPYFLNPNPNPSTTTASSDDDSLTPSTAVAASSTPSRILARVGDSGDGATVEVGRRPRGRPPGSKHKPKPPVIIMRDPQPAMSPYILEIPGGGDVVDAVTCFSRRRGTGLCVLTASGTVANVSLRQPSTPPSATVTFHGRFDLLSLSAAVFPHSAAAPPSLADNCFTISISGPQGQVVGGMVAGPLVSAGTVYVIAASFDNPSYHRLPEEGEESGGGEGKSPAAAEAEEEMSMYNSGHIGSDVMWAPLGGRQQQQQPPPPY